MNRVDTEYRKDIIRIAREAGCIESAIPDWVIRTCTLVASAEREKIAEYIDRNLMSCREYAEAIRARGQA